MNKYRLESFKKGWFIGDFEPSLFKTQDVEVAIKSYKEGDFEDSHFHKVATEYTVVIDGSVLMNGVTYVGGDIIEIPPGEGTNFRALENSRCLVVKVPGAINDKYDANSEGTTMDFTFGISAKEHNESMINSIIDTIEAQNIPNYEVIVVGNNNIDRKNTRVIPFDESIKRAWITKKKNLISELAQYQNVVYLHDYIKFDAGWYEGFLTFGSDFDVSMTKIINPDGSRYRDWTLWAENATSLGLPSHHCLLPYDESEFTRHMYISGAYWVAKKDFMLKHPLDERLVWGEGEDVEWCSRVRDSWNYRMNSNSTVSLMIYHGPVFSEVTEEGLNAAKSKQI